MVVLLLFSGIVLCCFGSCGGFWFSGGWWVGALLLIWLVCGGWFGYLCAGCTYSCLLLVGIALWDWVGWWVMEAWFGCCSVGFALWFG